MFDVVAVSRERGQVMMFEDLSEQFMLACFESSFNTFADVPSCFESSFINTCRRPMCCVNLCEQATRVLDTGGLLNLAKTTISFY